MRFEVREFIPVLLGGDINVYSMARAFYEQYQIKSTAFGKYQTGPAYRSDIIDYHANPDIDTLEVFLNVINAFAHAHSDKKILLIGCGDNYVALIAQANDAHQLEPNIVAPYAPYALLEQAQRKEFFYELCEKHNIPYPHTYVFTYATYQNGTGKAALDNLDFGFPMILKPSDGIMYWDHPFETQKKAYTIADRAELDQVINDVYASGYTDDLILQDMVPGNDEYMRVLTSYSDHTGKVRMMCLGHVLLEEHEPHAVGNHAAIITEPNEALYNQARILLEELGYTGFSNFDVKYDERDGTFKFFDFNTRQGRSNYYVTGSGFNVTKYVVEDYIYQRPFEGCELAQDEFLWCVVPHEIIYKYVKDPDLRERAHKLIREGHWVNPIFMRQDKNKNRWLRMAHTHLQHFKNFKRYYH